MKPQELSSFRKWLGKTQKEMASLLGVSLKAIQGYEQGWRNIPVHAERQVLYLVWMKNTRDQKEVPCWDIINCPSHLREKCPAWEFRIGNLCWFVNGTLCKGRTQGSWKEKIKICKRCKVFKERIKINTPSLSRPKGG
jgi:hypothetical protein